MENRKKTVEPNFICITGIVILFLILECVENFLPSWEVPIIIIKGFTSLIPFGLALFSTLKYPDYFNVGVTTVLFVYFLGDVLIRINFVAGVISFFIANLLLAFVFLKIRGFSKSQLILYLFSMVVFLVILISLKNKLSTLFYPIMIYSFVLIFMFVSSLRMNFGIKIASLAFFVSDILLAVGLAGLGNPVLSFFSLGIYYFSITLFANNIYLRTKIFVNN